MREAPGGYEEEATNSEKIERREELDKFLSELRKITTALQSRFRVERPKSPQEETSFEGVSTERLTEASRERRERKTETIWDTIRAEGFNQRNLAELLRNVESLLLSELGAIMAIIDDLILEWDPTMKWFLQNLKKEFGAMARIKASMRE